MEKSCRLRDDESVCHLHTPDGATSVKRQICFEKIILMHIFMAVYFIIKTALLFCQRKYLIKRQK
jgi:hypothetical protein